MIAPMKKLSLLLYHKEKESFLKSLQELGVVHIIETPDMHSENLETLQENIKAANHVLKVLKGISKVKKSSIPQNTKANAGEIVNQFMQLESEKENIEQQITAMKKNIAALEPWGDFEPASVARLKEIGITLRFFLLNEKKFNSLKKDELTYEIIKNQAHLVHFVVLEREKKVTIEAEESILPQISLTNARKKIEELQARKKEIEQSIEKFIAYQDILMHNNANKLSLLSLEFARLSMENAAEGKVLSLTGWIPSEKERKVAEFLDKFSAWHSFTEPTKDDNVPVLLKNKKTSALFEAITKIFILPDYFELDPTPFFAPFFAMFFGLCLGDAGYGLIIFVGALIALKKCSLSLKPVFKLGMILGVASIISGILLNTFFGQAIFYLPGFEDAFLQRGRTFAALGPIETKKGMVFPAMTFSLYVGIMQIILGIVIQTFNRANNNGLLYAIAPLSNILMVCAFVIFLVNVNFMDMGIYQFGFIEVGEWINSIPISVSLWLALIGFLLLILFNDPSKKILARIGLGFWKFYNFLSGVVSNGLSYLRLFALGLAGGLLGAAFNEIAFMLITNENGTVNYASFMTVFTILILVVGHTLNLGLSALGAFVHSLRLTFVEFYGNIDFKGGGKPFMPLSKTESKI